jgi:lysophospholipase L1-like esterase
VPIPELTPDPELEDVPFVPPVSADAFFDGSLFIGDSILEGIRLYVIQSRATETTLGSAEFLTSQAGIALKDLLGERDWGLGYRYQGESLPLEEILSRIAPTRVFLLLGLNDLADEDGNDAAAAVERYGRFLDRLGEWLPEAEVTVLLNPPKVDSSWLPDYTANRAFSNELIREFDQGLRTLCEEREIPWVDLYAALADEDGNLPDRYCRDGFLHLSSEGAALAVQALYDYASEKGAEP